MQKIKIAIIDNGVDQKYTVIRLLNENGSGLVEHLKSALDWCIEKKLCNRLWHKFRVERIVCYWINLILWKAESDMYIK